MNIVVRLASLLGAVILCVGLHLPQSALGEDAPQVIYSSDPDRPYPVWVAAEAAFHSGGEINEAVFSPGAQTFLADFLRMPLQDGCIQLEEFYSATVNAPDLSTLAKALSGAKAQMRARVAARDWGFGYGGTPGQLLTIAPLEMYRGKAQRDTYFIFIPVGEFAAGPASFCKIDRRFAEPPEPGEEVLLLLPEPIDLSEPLLDVWAAESLITLKKNGSVALPRTFAQQELTVKSRADLAELLDNCGHWENER